jgi:hypothetical protein
VRRGLPGTAHLEPAPIVAGTRGDCSGAGGGDAVSWVLARWRPLCRCGVDSFEAYVVREGMHLQRSAPRSERSPRSGPLAIDARHPPCFRRVSFTNAGESRALHDGALTLRRELGEGSFMSATFMPSVDVHATTTPARDSRADRTFQTPVARFQRSRMGVPCVRCQ